METFSYANWPVAAKGKPKQPTVKGAQWTAWIEAGGQHDAVVCHAPSQDMVIALRRHVLSQSVTTKPISEIAGVLLERIGIAIRLARQDKDEELFTSIDKILCKDIQTMDEPTMRGYIRSLENIIQDGIDRAQDVREARMMNKEGRPINDDPRIFIENLGYDIDVDSDQPGLWVWTAPSDGCDSSFATAKEALDSAWSDAVGQAMRIKNLSSGDWDAMSFDAQRVAMTTALASELPAFDALSADTQTQWVARVRVSDPDIGSKQAFRLARDEYVSNDGVIPEPDKANESLPSSEPTAGMEQRIATAVESAQEAFWLKVAELFPEAKSGDFPPGADMALQDAMSAAAKIWVEGNVLDVKLQPPKLPLALFSNITVIDASTTATTARRWMEELVSTYGKFFDNPEPTWTWNDVHDFDRNAFIELDEVVRASTNPPLNLELVSSFRTPAWREPYAKQLFKDKAGTAEL